VFVRNRLTAVNAVKVARETAEPTRLQFQCEMFTERLTTSLSLWYSYRSCLNAHHDVSPPCSPIPASLGHSMYLYPFHNSWGTGEDPSCFNRGSSEAPDAGRGAYVLGHNRAEGNAPLTVEGLVGCYAARRL